MERIVHGLSNINFESNCEDVLTEHRPPNFCATTTTATITTASGASFGCNFNYSASAMSSYTTSSSEGITSATILPTAPKTVHTAPDELNVNSNLQCEEISKEVNRDECDTNDNNKELSLSGSYMSLRRRMSSRVSKENTDLGIKHRAIVRLKNKSSEMSLFGDIQKIYMNQRLTSFRPTNLETIFEEPKPMKGGDVASTNNALDNEESEQSGDTNNQLRFIGPKKVRRSLSCSDGLNPKKRVIKQRRAKIKRNFGRRYSLRKIAFDDFLEHLNKSIETGGTGENTSVTPSLVDANGAATATKAPEEMDDE